MARAVDLAWSRAAGASYRACSAAPVGPHEPGSPSYTRARATCSLSRALGSPGGPPLSLRGLRGWPRRDRLSQMVFLACPYARARLRADRRAPHPRARRSPRLLAISHVDVIVAAGA
jgi:hypothetical protein